MMNLRIEGKAGGCSSILIYRTIYNDINIFIISNAICCFAC